MNPTFEVDNGALSLKPAILHKNMNILYVLCSVQIDIKIGFIKTSKFAYYQEKKIYRDILPPSSALLINVSLHAFASRNLSFSFRKIHFERNWDKKNKVTRTLSSFYKHIFLRRKAPGTFLTAPGFSQLRI